MFKKKGSKHFFDTLKIGAPLVLDTLCIVLTWIIIAFLYLPLVTLALLLPGLLVELYFRWSLGFIDTNIICGDGGADGSILLVIDNIDFINAALFVAYGIIYPIMFDLFTSLFLHTFIISWANKDVNSIEWIWFRLGFSWWAWVILFATLLTILYVLV